MTDFASTNPSTGSTYIVKRQHRGKYPMARKGSKAYMASRKLYKYPAKKFVKNIVKSMKEKQYLYASASVTPQLVNLQKVLINGCTQGDAIGNRTGDEINCSLLDLQLSFVYDWVAGPSIYGAYDEDIGIWVVQDKQTNGAVMADADFGGDGITCNALMRIDWDNRKRFNVLWHKIVHYEAPQMTASYGGVAETFVRDTLKLPIKLGFKTYYSGNAGTVADITRNSIYLIVAGSNTYRASYYSPKILYSYRMYYTE